MKTNCEECSYFVYDEEAYDYFCDIDISEDEMSRYLSDSNYECPYYRKYDEYAVVRKQM